MQGAFHGSVTKREALARLGALGLDEPSAEALFAHFDDAERRGKRGHGHARVAWLETQSFDPAARFAAEARVFRGPRPGWDGAGSLGYLVLQAICDDVVAEPPEGARLVVAARCFPTGMLGYWVRQLAERVGLVALRPPRSPGASRTRRVASR